MADKTGYIGRNPADSSVKVARQTFTPTTATTDFTFASGYTVGYLDLFLNGAKLIEGTDYNANNGSVISMVSDAQNGDVLEAVAYKAFNVGDSSASSTGNFSVGNDLTVSNDAKISNDLNVTGIATIGEGFNVTAGGINVVAGVCTFPTTVDINSVLDVSSYALFGNDVRITGNTNAGIATFTGIVNAGSDVRITGNINAGIATFTGDVAIGGTLTYADVTNIDSVGLVTARNGLRVLAGGIQAVGLYTGFKASGVSTFAGGDILIDGSAVGVSSVTWDASADTLEFKDNSVAAFGDSDDLKIYHTGTQSRIENSGTGEIRIQVDTLQITDKEGSDMHIECNHDGNVELYYDNSKKLETTTAGIVVTGIATATQTVEATLGLRALANGLNVVGISTLSGWVSCGDTVALGDNKAIYLGADEDLAVYHDTTDSIIKGNTGELKLMTDTFRVRSNDNSETLIRALKDGAVELYYDDAKKLETINQGVIVTGITTTTQLSVGPGVLREALGPVSGGGISGTVNHDVLTNGMVYYQSSNAGGSFVFNLRGDGSTTFNSLIKINETTTFTIYSPSDGTANYMTDFQIDGSSITEKWAAATAPSAATGSGVDCYAMTILKTADATFTVFGNFTNFG